MSSDPTLSPIVEQTAAAENDRLAYRLDDANAWTGRVGALLAETGSATGGTEGRITEYTSRHSAMGTFRNYVGLGEFAQFVPFAARPINQLRLLYHTRKVIADLPPTRRVFTTADILNRDGNPCAEPRNAGSTMPRSFLYMQGAFPDQNKRKTSAGQTRYSNPGYVHRHLFTPVTDPGERRDWALRLAGYGVVDPDRLAIPFGVTEAADPAVAVERELANLDIDYEAIRLRSMRRVARMWAVCNVWGYSQRDLAAAFGVSKTMVHDWIRRVTDAGFVAPSVDPTWPPEHRDRYGHADVDIRGPPAGLSPWRD